MDPFRNLTLFAHRRPCCQYPQKQLLSRNGFNPFRKLTLYTHRHPLPAHTRKKRPSERNGRCYSGLQRLEEKSEEAGAAKCTSRRRKSRAFLAKLDIFLAFPDFTVQREWRLRIL